MSIAVSFHGAGGRKRARARVLLIPVKTGVGQFTVNKKIVTDYFPELAAVDTISEPLQVVGASNLLNQFNIKVTVKGGGKSGQRDATRLGLAKALVMLDTKNHAENQPIEVSSEEEADVSTSWRRKLRKAKLLTTDSRKVEPKRYGLDKARKRAPLVKR